MQKLRSRYRLFRQQFVKTFVLAIFVSAQCVFAKEGTQSAPLIVKPIAGKSTEGVAIWLESSLKRIFPASPAGSTNLNLLAARNGKIAFQVGLRNREIYWQHIECSLADADDLKSQVRLVGFVPVQHFTGGTEPDELDGIGFLPGLVPDPLMPRTSFDLGSQESRSFWITLEIPPDAKPGVREIKVQLSVKQLFIGNKDNVKVDVELPVTLEISPFVIQPRHDFSVTHWWSADAIYDYYKCQPFDERWFEIVQPYLKDMLDHGSDVLYVPIFYMRREVIPRPSQLLIVNETSPGKYNFDWSRVKRFVELGKKIGFKKFEWTHLWIYWGLENPIRVYTKRDGKMELLWPADISGFSDTYVGFLKQFLPEFHDFLEQENILENSFFHISDEPGGSVEKYRHARQIVRDIAPWMKTMDALSDIRYGRQGLTDIPVPQLGSAQAYIDEKIPHWVYFCCSPTGPWLNRFEDTPLPKIRMAGFLFYRLGAKGFLHWAYNYWFKMETDTLADVFNDTTGGGGVPAGDPFEVYPGENGPIDSIRWEVFGEALQDYAILQTAGIKPGDPILSDLKSYAVFPKNEQWIRNTIQEILKREPLETSAR